MAHNICLEANVCSVCGRRKNWQFKRPKLRPHPIHLLTISIIFNYVKLYIIRLSNYFKKRGPTRTNKSLFHSTTNAEMSSPGGIKSRSITQLGIFCRKRNVIFALFLLPQDTNILIDLSLKLYYLFHYSPL
jgi:hypothetical protein